MTIGKSHEAVPKRVASIGIGLQFFLCNIIAAGNKKKHEAADYISSAGFYRTSFFVNICLLLSYSSQRTLHALL